MLYLRWHAFALISVSMAERFFSITTEFMRAQLRQAYACAVKNNHTLAVELTLRQGVSLEVVADGSPLKMQSANGHSALVMDAGAGSAAPQEFVEMWENLLSRTGRPVGIGVEPATAFLNFCVDYGLDPECNSSWCLFDIFTNQGAGAAGLPTPVSPVPDDVTDATIYAFVAKNLVPITEMQSDYGPMRTAGGMQFV